MAGDWTLRDCFVGPECWCAILVDPSGKERCRYGEVRREIAALMVQALNGTGEPDADPVFLAGLPWDVRARHGTSSFIESSKYMEWDECQDAWWVDPEVADQVVEAVNRFYGSRKNSI